MNDEKQNSGNGSVKEGNSGKPPPRLTPAWDALRPGDTVFLIAPSTPTDDGTVRYAATLFAEMGLKVAYSPAITNRFYNWGGTAEQRAQQIIDALYDPRVKAIYSLEGGEGASEVVGELKKREAELLKAPNRGIPLIGASDSTFLHHYLGERGIVSPVQGPPSAHLTANRGYMVYENGTLAAVDLSQSTNDEARNKVAQWERSGVLVSRPRSEKEAAVAKANLRALKDLLMDGEPTMPRVELHAVNNAARRATKIEGVLVGGSDQITAIARFTTHGASALLNAAAGKPVLFIEGKSLGEMEDTLTLLRKSGDLLRYQAIVFGKYYANPTQTEPEFPKHQTAEILKRLGINDSLPVFEGFPFGHASRGAEIKPLPLYTHAVIEVTHGTALMSVDRSGAKKDLDSRAAKSVQATPNGAVRKDRGAVSATIDLSQPWAGTVEKLMATDMSGKAVTLHFDMDAKQAGNTTGAINPVHFFMMPLIASRKLKDVSSVTIAADGAFSHDFDKWLADFSHRHLPGVTVKTAVAEPNGNKSEQRDQPVTLKKRSLDALIDRIARLAGAAAGWARR
ncbi:MAG TPA: LD-carboxypeptidase [Planctomycetaceae bacterium]|jgi:muramoyltetrapeptide carboxypeptidase LdcA involved in peptidoglycan recycling|nr:LD-carboxypeptidase [Planctomycetaceae bacterium]